MRCAIVDPYSSARFLPPILRRHRIGPVHVLSGPAVPSIFRSSASTEALDGAIVYQGDLDGTAAALRERGVRVVLAGAESGVELADALSERLGTPGHGMTNPRVRRDKYEMAKVLRAAGIAAADTVCSSSLAEILAWARRRRAWPVVVKPVDSAATDNVIFCESEDEVRAAFRRIHGSVNVVGRPNRRVLAQELLRGEECFVNAVSRGGEHHVAEVWRYRKRRVALRGSI